MITTYTEKIVKKKKRSASKVELNSHKLTEIAGKAVYNASKKAMKTMGYVDEVVNGWVVRKYANGDIKRLKKLKESTSTLVFD